ncbi:hypothetical protein BJ875DRAFT_14493 [Amylocarpus encephaloides]|uniref:Uncharacterized protein n=1 Tax=Amylocarpus encephaloides TaxID=45428 RepID=A0A9P7YS66_9HELO|nr:hypothetical protein BJ875DRAFT_14493 [Amylocarpus encephaloides]
MNRFRTKKKAKEAPDGPIRVSTESDVPSIPPVKKSRTFGRSKKIPEPEPLPEPKLDVANALPPSDDFRTSLLMNGLSARFSMLREQDDPKSKIGKASDDSVLFPKPQSKFNDFNFQSPYGLSDIAEVSSIKGSIRPPFAAMERKDSYSTLTGSFGTDDDSIHSGSIMNRSKPGEGNNLFGGRQKIYKLPANSTASSKSLADGSGMGGRAVYDHDVSQSAFQKLREREREQERERLAMEESEAQSSRPPSPPLSGYNRNRETSSTTSSSGPSITRASTAATSFSSQRTPSVRGDQTPVTPGGSISNGGLERSTTKARRLYETGLDQHLHDQQHSAMSRIDTLSKRSIGTRTPPLNSPTTSFQAVERWDKQVLAGKASMPNLRPTSPTLNPGLNSFDFAVKSTDHPDSRSYGMSSPPLSPPITENEDVVVLSVRPNDRGKATALGTFSKPAQSYDEGKYSQRQVQMQQGRETPPLRKHAPPDAFAPHHQQQNGRSRAGSNATFASVNSGRSRSNSSAQRQFLPQGIPEIHPPKTYPQIPENRAVSGTFLSSPDESAVSSPAEPPVKVRNNQVPLDLSKMNFQNRNVSLERPDESQHPAHRNSPAEIPTARNEDHNVAPPRPLTPDDQKSAVNLPADSPTLGPASTMTGLSGMVRQHLRSESNSSSIYGGVSSGPPTSRFPPDQTYYNSSSNPWDNETWDQGYYDNTQDNSEAQVSEARNLDVISPLAVQSSDSLPIEENRKSSWEKESEAHHTRNESTETQKERLDFKNELAERRRRVQENLKSFVETDSRSASPGPEIPKEQPSVRANALGLLRAKTSRGSLVVRTREPPQSKAMKMLGIGSATMTTSPSPSRQEFDETIQNREEAETSDGAVKDPTMTPQTRAFRQARRDAQRDRERQMAMRHQSPMGVAGHNPEWSPATAAARSPREPPSQRVPPNIHTGGQQRSPSRERQRPPMTTRAPHNGSQQSQGSMGSSRSGSSPPGRPSRDRSSSGDSSGRSKSRNGKYRDDLAKAMAEGVSSSSQRMYNELSVPTAAISSRSPVGGLPASPSPMPSPMMQLPNTSRSRSNSRVGASPLPSPYPEPQSLQPVKTDNGQYGLPLSPRPSPTAPFSINPTPTQPSPAGPGAAAPTVPVSQPQTRIPGARKKSINKHDISEPKFVSSTSRITTVNLPPEASLQNGMDILGAPPIPPVNPARRQPRGMFSLRGKKDGIEEIQNMPAATQSTEEMSTFSDDGESKPRVRQKLRKSSSEGGNLNARARQAASAKPGPAMPTNNFGPSRGNSPPRPAEGGMF